MEEGNMPEVVEVEKVRGYVDGRGVAWLNAEDVARGLGFVEVRKDRVATCGDKLNLSDEGVSIDSSNYYTVVRWARVNSYLREFDYPKEVGKEDYIPENMFYFLAMKASNDTAKAFQAKIANEILPNIRKYGYYVAPAVKESKVGFKTLGEVLERSLIEDLRKRRNLLVEECKRLEAIRDEGKMVVVEQLKELANMTRDGEMREKLIYCAACVLLDKPCSELLTEPVER